VLTTAEGPRRRQDRVGRFGIAILPIVANLAGSCSDYVVNPGEAVHGFS